MDDKYAALVRLFLTIEWDDNDQCYQQIDTLLDVCDRIKNIICMRRDLLRQEFQL